MKMTMQCPYCKGRGWQWVGSPYNAYRTECQECQGKGNGSVNWGTLGGILVIFLGIFLGAGMMTALFLGAMLGYAP